MSMWINIGVSVLNIILDAIFIGYLKLGIEYAALASSLSMSIGTLILICKTNLKMNQAIDIGDVDRFSKII